MAYLIDFAKSRSLEYRKDSTGNVVIRKGASPGMENRPVVVLQSHVDMVCEKRGDVNFHFDTDPIRTRVEDGWVRAEGTTLGADCGIGMAAELAVLDADRSGTRSGRVSFHRRRGDRPDRRFRPRRGHAEREISDQSRLGGRGPAFHRLRRRNRHGSDDALSSGGGAEELRFFPHRHRRPFGRSLGRRHRQGTGQLEQTARPFPVAGGAADGNEAGIPRRRKSPQRDSPRGFRRIRRTRRATPSAFGSFSRNTSEASDRSSLRSRSRWKSRCPRCRSPIR